MKIRTDFVTNSSSSSFILAQKGEFSDKQKAAIMKYICEQFLGEVILTPESTEEDILNAFDENYIDDDEQQEEIRKALKEGKSIHWGMLHFECLVSECEDVYQDVWKILEEHGDGAFSGIDTDLRY